MASATCGDQWVRSLIPCVQATTRMHLFACPAVVREPEGQRQLTIQYGTFFCFRPSCQVNMTCPLLMLCQFAHSLSLASSVRTTAAGSGDALATATNSFTARSCMWAALSSVGAFCWGPAGAGGAHLEKPRAERSRGPLQPRST